MQYIGRFSGKQIYWLDYSKFDGQFPGKNLVCLAVTNGKPDVDKFDQFVRATISSGILEFKAHGKCSELLHDLFDDTTIVMTDVEGFSEIEVVTTWHNDETLAETFWQCFFATSYSNKVSNDEVKIFCTDLDGVERSEELRKYIKKFERGWMPFND